VQLLGIAAPPLAQDVDFDTLFTPPVEAAVLNPGAKYTPSCVDGVVVLQGNSTEVLLDSQMETYRQDLLNTLGIPESEATDLWGRLALQFKIYLGANYACTVAGADPTLTLEYAQSHGFQAVKLWTPEGSQDLNDHEVWTGSDLAAPGDFVRCYKGTADGSGGPFTYVCDATSGQHKFVQLRLPGASRVLELIEIQAWAVSAGFPISPPPSQPPPTPPPPPPSPPPPRQDLVVDATLTLAAALLDARTGYPGRPVIVSIGAGTHQLNASDGTFDGAVTASEVWLEGEGSAVLASAGDGPVLTVGGAPQCAPVSLINMTVHGRIEVLTGGMVFVRACTFVPDSLSPGRAALGGGLRVAGGVAEVRDSRFVGLDAERGGALAVTNGSLAVHDSELTSNNATLGGALYASGGTLVVMGSRLTLNEAADAGGAIYVNGAAALLGQRTWLHQNAAPTSRGVSAFLAAGALTYALPGPLATWVISATHCSAAQPSGCGGGWERLPEMLDLHVHSIPLGPIDDDFPLSCSAHRQLKPHASPVSRSLAHPLVCLPQRLACSGTASSPRTSRGRRARPCVLRATSARDTP